MYERTYIPLPLLPLETSLRTLICTSKIRPRKLIRGQSNQGTRFKYKGNEKSSLLTSR